MIKFYKDICIREYSSADYALVKKFQELSLQEGSESLTFKKYDPETISGQTWLAILKDQLIGISACEASHYTGDPLIAARICRYHILRPYRHSNVGFRILPYQVEWAKKKAFKVIYWTNDVLRKSINLLYQHKRIMPGKNEYFQTEMYKSFQLQNRMLFKVCAESDFLQYIYAKKLEKSYIWEPKTNVIFYSHSGEALNTGEVLERAKDIKYSYKLE